ncbi:MAG TPA: competence/damage-inducible protein A [Candidatus Baltobacteraceae bacterium]|jgi:nicotinamide-nucleotide amidase|nr:competence/damage-inducible protein A [Candidatus Baltobacteraceae bacterium]
MHIELINTGQELLLGRVLNTHQQWICRQLADLGYEVNRQICVDDDGPAIQAAVRESLGRSDLVLTTGGLGPTSDDLTRELIARLLGRELALDQAILSGIEQYFMRRHGVMAASAKVQAMVPAGARILPNAWGTAPGLGIEVNPNPFRDGGGRSWVVLLPGPPREMRPMFTNSVAPLLLTEFPASANFFSRTLKTTGLGESLVEEEIVAPLQPLIARGLDLGYCARIGEVEVRLAARGDQAGKLVEEAEAIVRGLLRNLIFAVDDGTMEQTVVGMLTEQNKTLAVAESCTGGLIAHRLTNVPGASAILKCGLVTYSNEAKSDLLGVSAFALAQDGAVSETVARQMAEGARKRCNTDYAVSVTGIAGPGGGSEAKPVGTVFIALADANGTVAKRRLNPFDRETFKFVTSQQALDLLRRRMISEDLSGDPSR